MLPGVRGKKINLETNSQDRSGEGANYRNVLLNFISELACRYFFRYFFVVFTLARLVNDV